MKIKYNQAVELPCALMQYAHWSKLTSPDIAGYSVSRELVRWHQTAEMAVSSLLDNDIKYLIGNFIGLVFLPVELALKQELETAPELIDALRGLSENELCERLYRSYNTGIPFEQVRNDEKKLRQAVEMAGGTIRKNEAGLFVDFVKSPGAFRDRLAGMMEDFYRIAIEPFLPEAVALAEAQAAEDQAVLETDPQLFFKEFCRIEGLSAVSTPQIFISFFSELDIIQMENPPAVIYGRSRAGLRNISGIPLEQIYSLFADESRRKILQLLCRKAWFIRELADELGITSATVSYHMNRLSSLDLVTYEQRERRRVYYKADRKKVASMLKTVERDFLG